MKAVICAECSIKGRETGLHILPKLRGMAQKIKRRREVGPIVLGLNLNLKVTQVKVMGLNLGKMESTFRALYELVQMTNGVYLVRMASQEAEDEIYHCFCIDARHRIILDVVDTCAIRSNKRIVWLFGMNKKVLHVADVLMIA